MVLYCALVRARSWCPLSDASPTFTAASSCCEAETFFYYYERQRCRDVWRDRKCCELLPSSWYLNVSTPCISLPHAPPALQAHLPHTALLKMKKICNVDTTVFCARVHGGRGVESTMIAAKRPRLPLWSQLRAAYSATAGGVSALQQALCTRISVSQHLCCCFDGVSGRVPWRAACIEVKWCRTREEGPWSNLLMNK